MLNNKKVVEKIRKEIRGIKLEKEVNRNKNQMMSKIRKRNLVLFQEVKKQNYKK